MTAESSKRIISPGDRKSSGFPRRDRHELHEPVMVKSQVKISGRGKAGGGEVRQDDG